MPFREKRLARFVAPAAVLLLLPLLACKAGTEKKADDVAAQVVKAPDVAARVAKFAPTEIGVDPAGLSAEDRAVVNKLIEAAQAIDGIFWKQSYPAAIDLKAKLEASTDPADADYLKFLLINAGPFDRQDENKPFYGTATKPLGAGFYPLDLTAKEFEAYVAAHPGEREALESPFTVVKRRDARLEAVPYSVEYKAELEKAAGLLNEAAALSSNPSFKAYLTQRAKDFLSNDYYPSDCLWIDTAGSRPEIVIGPYEVYEDALLGLKASFESYVYVNDFEAMKKLRAYIDILDEMQQSLPVEPKYRAAKIKGLDSPLNVVDELFTAGDCKAGVQTAAFVLPNDEKVREKKGTKKIFLKNMMEAKFQKTLVPISRRVLAEADAARVTFEAFFTEVLLHEICHVLGTDYVVLPDGTKTTVNKALKDRYTAIEEGKADILGIVSVPLLIQKGLIPKNREAEIYTAYLAGMFRVMRFGVTEAHGLGVLVQYNFLREQGGFVLDAAANRLAVDPVKIEAAVRELARKFLVVEGDGDYAKAVAFLNRYGKMDDATKAMIETLKDLPVDIAPIYRTQY